MNEENKNRQGQLQIELPQEISQGEYANFAIITHSSSDFVLDFARVLPWPDQDSQPRAANHFPLPCRQRRSIIEERDYETEVFLPLAANAHCQHCRVGIVQQGLCQSVKRPNN